PTTLLSFGPLGSVLRAALFASGDADGVQGTADHVIAHAGQVLDAAAADQHDRVLLQVVADARDVCRYFDPVGQADTRYFSQRRVRLFRRLGIDARSNPALLRTRLERRARRLVLGRSAPELDQLIKCRHKKIVLSSR